jgi:hypothetical protein
VEPKTRDNPPKAATKDPVAIALDKARQWFGQSVQDLDEVMPSWRAMALLDFVADALANLRQAIEEDRIAHFSWEAPIVAIDYPVAAGDDDLGLVVGGRFAGERSTAATMANGVLTVERFTAADVVDGVVPEEVLFEALAEHARAMLLRGLTHGIIQWRERATQGADQRPRYMIPEDVRDYLDRATETTVDEHGVHGSPEAVALRACLVDELAKPFSIGATLIDLDVHGNPHEPIPAHVVERLVRETKDLPTIQATVSLDDGTKRTVAVVLVLNPLVIDIDEKRAFYPFFVGLVFEDIGDKRHVHKWEPHIRAALWDELDRALHEEVEKIGAEQERHGVQRRRRTETPSTPATSTLQPTVREAPFPLAFRRTIMDNGVADMLGRLHAIRLPVKRWATLPTLAELEALEVRRLRAELGDEAEQKTADRGPLIHKRTRKGETVYVLSSEAVRELKVRHGLGKGYRDLDHKTGEEYLVRLFQLATRGYLEVGLSWERMAGPWVEEWRKNLDTAAAREEENRRASLFESIDDEHREKVDRLLVRVNRLSDGWKVLELVLSELGASGSNPVRLPAVAMKNLLHLSETDPHAKDRIEAALESLRAISVRVRSFGGESVRAYGSLVSWWEYHGAGAGSHAAGDYVVRVTPEAVGCLKVFESGTHRLASGREVTNYAFGKPDENQKKGLKGVGFVGFDSGRVFYNAAEDFSSEERAFVAFLEKELTTNLDTARDWPKGRKKTQRPPTAADARKPRVYLSDFCPLLEPGRPYHGCLGHFRRNAEAGWTLAGARTRSTDSGGAHTEGLLGRLGFLPPPGKVSAERTRQIRRALEVMKGVAVDYLEGVVAAKDEGGRWLSLKDAAALPENELKRVRWFFFLPENWDTIRRQKWEDRQEERARKGLAAFAYKATDNPDAAAAARLLLQGQAHVVEANATTGETSGLVLVRHRLRLARLDRGLSHRAVGRVFDVSEDRVQKWERGAEPDPEDGRVRGSPIPVALVPLIVRWVEQGVEPTAKELAEARPGRRGRK